ncbi:hypothetical protein [Henriciella aquimarina]|uniref:hypothetical protein n=1 Tax=Henriciella aquimarina TaxID=545261 RepID=UPI00117A0963|nr:hypothetical protein [Henriciella aquimarina]
MKKTAFGLLGLMTLAACGGGGSDRAAIVDACMNDNANDKKTCECMADAAEKNLDKGLYSKLAKAAREGEESANEIMGDLTPEQQGQFMSFAMQAAMTCGMSE